MGLNAFRCRDHDSRGVKNCKCPFHLSREIDMARRIDDIAVGILPDKMCFLIIDRDAMIPFQHIVIQKRVLMIDSAFSPDGSGLIEHRFNACSLARIDMGKNSDRNSS